MRRNAKFNYKGLVIQELFISLGKALRDAVGNTYGPDVWLVDFSTKEVIYSKNFNNQAEILYKVRYKVKRGEVVFDGVSKVVDRKVTFEKEVMTVSDFTNLVDIEMRLED